MNIPTDVKKYIDKSKSKPWFWYVVVAVITIISYPYIVDLLTKQFSVYTLHFGDPASYVFILAIYGLWFETLYRRKWGHGKMGIRGNALLGFGAVSIILILVYVFGYQFLWLKGG